MKRTVVVGSVNRDYTFLLDHLPDRGETILSRRSYSSTGGKGANQAAALSKMGLEVAMIGAVGADEPGERAVEALAAYGVSVDHIIKKNVPTGSAFICVDKNAHNTIVVDPGANGALSCEDIDSAAQVIAEADFCLMQLEINLEVVAHAAEICREHGGKVVLNPAPAQKIPDELLSLTDYLIPNETELALLTGCEVNCHTAVAAARRLTDRGVKAVIATMGEEGSCYVDGRQDFFIPAAETRAVDTTAAGDSYIGAFLSALSRGYEVRTAMEFASLAASITVSRQGAADSIPLLEEVERLL